MTRKKMIFHVGIRNDRHGGISNHKSRTWVFALLALLFLALPAAAGPFELPGHPHRASTPLELAGHGIRQQDIEVRGTVRDTTNSVLAGVSITVKDRRTIGTTTDLNGRYILNVPSGSTLVFS